MDLNTVTLSSNLSLLTLFKQIDHVREGQGQRPDDWLLLHRPLVPLVVHSIGHFAALLSSHVHRGHSSAHRFDEHHLQQGTFPSCLSLSMVN